MMETTVKFEGSDYRALLDVLIDANRRLERQERQVLQVEVEGHIYDLHGVANLINEKIGYETELTDEHDERLNADYHNRLIKKRQYGYGHAARNLADRALGVGAFSSPSPAQREAVRRIWERQAQEEAAKKAALEEAARNQATLQACAHALQEAALAAHPGWREIIEPVLIVGGRTFVKANKKAPGTLNGLVRWFEKVHPDQADRIRAGDLKETGRPEGRP